MTRLLLIAMLRGILGLNIADVSHFCITWDIKNETLKLTCRVRQFEDAIYIHDIYGRIIGQCNSGHNSMLCTKNQYSEMKAEVENKLVKLLIHIPSYGQIDGVWTCLQNGENTTAVVSRHRGIVVSTDTDITGRFINETTKDIVLTCSTCRVPRMNLAEFFINGKTVDSIAYNDESSACSHQHGACRSNICNCSSNIFVLFIRLPPNASGGHFSCDMRFDDVVKEITFDKFASVSLEDRAFRAEITTTNITKSGYFPVTQATSVAEITFSSVSCSHNTQTVTTPVQKDMKSLWIGILTLFACFLAFGMVFVCYCYQTWDFQLGKNTDINCYEEVDTREERQSFCQTCAKETSYAFCSCRSWFCEYCAEHHHHAKPDHAIVQIREEFKICNMKLKCMNCSSTSPQKICKQCSNMVCENCTGDHKNHSFKRLIPPMKSNNFQKDGKILDIRLTHTH